MVQQATTQDLAALQSIWSAAFAEDEAYTSFVLTHCLSCGTVLWNPENCTCITLFPLDYVLPGQKLAGFYLYGLATHPHSQRKGYASALLQETVWWAKAQRAAFLLLFPASENLESFYRARGFSVSVNVPKARICPTQPIAMETSEGPEYPMWSGLAFRAEYSFCWSAKMQQFAYDECVFRGGFATADGLCYPCAEGWEIKSTVLPVDPQAATQTALAVDFNQMLDLDRHPGSFVLPLD